MKNKQWFSLVELVVAITILVVLSSIWFISYTNTLVDARNSTRISDMGNIKMSLKNHKLKNGTYPTPWDSFDITNSWVIIKQWLLNDNVMTQEIIKKPTDPLVKSQYYFYSVSSNKLFFQIAMSLEDETLNDYNMRAYIDGNYQTLNDEFIPSLVFASNTAWDIQTLSWTAIVDKWTLNLPYDNNGNIIQRAWNLTEILSESEINIPKFYGYYSCQEIYQNGASMGSGTYMIITDTGEVSPKGCDMDD